MTEEELLQAAAQGDQAAFDLLFTRYRERLKQLVGSKIDPRLAARVDESDVIQEVYLDVFKRLASYLKNPDVSFYNWLRFLAKQKVAEIIRRHVATKSRDVRRELDLAKSTSLESSLRLAGYFVQVVESPSVVLSKQEVKQLVHQALDALDSLDREVLLMRHVEQLTTSQTAERLQISANTCRQRHRRALIRLRVLLQAHQLDLDSQV